MGCAMLSILSLRPLGKMFGMEKRLRLAGGGDGVSCSAGEVLRCATNIGDMFFEVFD